MNTSYKTIHMNTSYKKYAAEDARRYAGYNKCSK